MTLQDILIGIHPARDRALEHLSYELSKIRAGQASPALVEDVQVDVFGSKMPLKQLAGISVPERTQILVQPWDKSYLEPIEKALQQATTGASPVVERDSIRITLPPLTEEFRRKLEKVVAEKAEEVREAVRRIRDDAWGDIQEKARLGELREDDKFRGKEELQKLVDGANRNVEEQVERKLNEIRG